MKSIMAIFFVFPSLAFAQSSNEVCIGERCGGQKVSWAYMQSNPILKSAPGSIVKSFTVSYISNNTSVDKNITGNSLITILPSLKTLAVGQKIYFDNVTIAYADGKIHKTSAVFTLENYTNTDKIFLGDYFNGDTILFKIQYVYYLRYIDPNYEVKGFTLSYSIDESLVDKNILGNKIPSDVPITRLKSNSRIYFSNIRLQNRTNLNDVIIRSAIFFVK